MVLARWLHSLIGSRKAPARSSRPARGQLCLEALEDRALPSGGPVADAPVTGGGPGGSSGGPPQAVLSTGGPSSGQVDVVTPTGQGGPDYPIPPVTGPGLTGSFGNTPGGSTTMPVSLQGSTVAVVPVLVATSGQGTQSSTGGPPTSGITDPSSGTTVALNTPTPGGPTAPTPPTAP
jgi:hypothetical protein